MNFKWFFSPLDVYSSIHIRRYYSVQEKPLHRHISKFCRCSAFQDTNIRTEKVYNNQPLNTILTPFSVCTCEYFHHKAQQYNTQLPSIAIYPWQQNEKGGKSEGGLGFQPCCWDLGKDIVMLFDWWYISGYIFMYNSRIPYIIILVQIYISHSMCNAMFL